MKYAHIFLFFGGIFGLAFSQTANDTVPPYTGIYRYGSNTSGRTGGWDDVAMANIAAGNAAVQQPGAGVRSFRTALPAHFLQSWGYGIRLSEFAHYASLGMADHTVFMEGPPVGQEATASYCPGTSSLLFRNLYSPIWDAGVNGTPYNDTNYYAAYVYQLVDTYHPYVKFWEVMNEPDFTSTSHGWQPPGAAGNWWDNPPDPCDLDNVLAPVFHYIRMLRISYEVIKSIDAQAYVAVGGLGYPSFLDAILRYTDNPGAADGGTAAPGSPAAGFPLTGGAYFDCMSMHSYPQFSNRVNGNPKQRHSDAAAWGDIDKKDSFQAVLHAYGYDGSTFPEKIYLITETNIARASFNGYIGGNEVQRNYLIKSSVLCQMNDIAQMYIFSLDDRQPVGAATASHDLMGLYQDLSTTPNPYDQIPNDIAIANRSLSAMLFNTRYDSSETARLNLPAGVAGAAFRQPDGEMVYVLWAETSLDQDETASALYSFPPGMGISFVERFEWNYGQSGNSVVESSAGIALTAAPAFFRQTTGQPLPIAWQQLQATAYPPAYVRLQWQSPGQTDARQFFIERSVVGVDFSTIGTVNALENAVYGQMYTFDDKLPLNGINHYRIVQMNKNGGFSTSPVVVAAWQVERPQLRLGPNPLPAGQPLRIFCSACEGMNGSGRVLDMLGNEVFQFHLSFQNGQQNLFFDRSGIKSGIYVIKFVIKGNSFVQKFVIRE